MKLILPQPQLSYGPDADNIGTIRRLVESRVDYIEQDDILLLPEHVEGSSSRDAYDSRVSELARGLGCYVVGGSHHEQRGEEHVNAGVAVAPDGSPIGRYEKLRPYADERQRVVPGRKLGEIVIADRKILVLICADFWFADLFTRASRLSSLVLVPALSVSRKPTPEYSRALWRHLAVARAYEFGMYVGVCDWGHPSELPALSTSGVAGFADPTAIEPAKMFQPVEDEIHSYEIDFAALDAFRDDRMKRGFFWKE